MKPPGHDEVAQLGHLEISENIAFQKASWRWQRIGTILTGLFLLAGVIGVFGGGLVGRVKTCDGARQVDLEYPRFLRADARDTIIVEIRPEMSRGAALGVWMDSSLLEHTEIEHIHPRPGSEVIAGKRVIHWFQKQDTEAYARIVFQIHSSGFGRNHGRLGIEGGPEFEISQFIYP